MDEPKLEHLARTPPPSRDNLLVGVSGRLYAIGGLTPPGGGQAGGTDTNIIGRAFCYAPTEPPETRLDPRGELVLARDHAVRLEIGSTGGWGMRSYQQYYVYGRRDHALRRRQRRRSSM